jgi:hypothetical protein
MTPTAKADNMADWIIPVALQSEEQKTYSTVELMFKILKILIKQFCQGPPNIYSIDSGTNMMKIN